MRRAIPLAKIVLWMIIVCTILSVLLSLLMILVIESGKSEPTPSIFIQQFLERDQPWRAVWRFDRFGDGLVRRRRPLDDSQAGALPACPPHSRGNCFSSLCGREFPYRSFEAVWNLAICADCHGGKQSSDDYRANDPPVTFWRHCQVRGNRLHESVRSRQLLARSRGTISEVKRTGSRTICKPLRKSTQPLCPARRRSRASRAGLKLGLKVSAAM